MKYPFKHGKHHFGYIRGVLLYIRFSYLYNDFTLVPCPWTLLNLYRITHAFHVTPMYGDSFIHIYINIYPNQKTEKGARIVRTPKKKQKQKTHTQNVKEMSDREKHKMGSKTL